MYNYGWNPFLPWQARPTNLGSPPLLFLICWWFRFRRPKIEFRNSIAFQQNLWKGYKKERKEEESHQDEAKLNHRMIHTFSEWGINSPREIHVNCQDLASMWHISDMSALIKPSGKNAWILYSILHGELLFVILIPLPFYTVFNKFNFIVC